MSRFIHDPIFEKWKAWQGGSRTLRLDRNWIYVDFFFVWVAIWLFFVFMSKIKFKVLTTMQHWLAHKWWLWTHFELCQLLFSSTFHGCVTENELFVFPSSIKWFCNDKHNLFPSLCHYIHFKEHHRIWYHYLQQIDNAAATLIHHRTWKRIERSGKWWRWERARVQISQLLVT